ncbi:MAG: hypothetical protein AAF292_11125 [Pseudomonadota bacterium]
MIEHSDLALAASGALTIGIAILILLERYTSLEVLDIFLLRTKKLEADARSVANAIFDRVNDELRDDGFALCLWAGVGLWLPMIGMVDILLGITGYNAGELLLGLPLTLLFISVFYWVGIPSLNAIIKFQQHNKYQVYITAAVGVLLLSVGLTIEFKPTFL